MILEPLTHGAVSVEVILLRIPLFSVLFRPISVLSPASVVRIIVHKREDQSDAVLLRLSHREVKSLQMQTT